MNEYGACVVLVGLAANRTRVVEPARAPAAATTIDEAPVRQAEKERVSCDAFAPVSAKGDVPGLSRRSPHP